MSDLSMEEYAPGSYTVRLTSETEASGLPFSQADWDQTPKAIQAFVISALTHLQELRQKVDKIDSKLKQNMVVTPFFAFLFS
jgi:hypothetical protein